MKKYRADWIDKYQFGYLCKECGETHRHGNNLQYHNRVESRTSHCSVLKGNILIEIDKETQRILK